MSTFDTINGIYESIGVFFVALNIKAICRDRSLKGFSVIPLVFFTSWGAWNLLYYPSLHQWISTFGALSTFLANVVYLFYCFKYRA